MTTLEIKDLHVSVSGADDAEDIPILKGVDLTVNSGETHALMGPNGSGKSTLSYAIAGHPKYTVTSGSITLDGQDVLAMTVDERARAGLFLAMQYPDEVHGGVLLITHYTRILRYIQPQFVHVFVGGRIVESGGPELADELEENGYERFAQQAAAISSSPSSSSSS